MIKLTIDNKVVEAEEGSTVLEAANKAAIHIPTLCYNEFLNSIGSCRVCVVEIVTDGTSKLTPSCTYPVAAGLKVITNSEKVIEARKLAVELLMARRPHSAKIQELADRLGIKEPAFTLEQDECILCELCVRTCHKIVGVDAISFIDQGKDRAVENASVLHSYERCIACDSCAYICPTEAITIAKKQVSERAG